MAQYDLAEKYLPVIQETYTEELKSGRLLHTNPQVSFINAETIKVPTIKGGGFGNHDRSVLGFNSSVSTNAWEPYKLNWDRDIEIFIDPMDIDESNTVLSMANHINNLTKNHLIPEKDKYRFSKLYKEAVEKGATVDTEAVTAANILTKFDAAMEAMDEASVNEGRILYVTPKTYTMLKQAEGIQRTLEVSGKANVNRLVHSLDDVEIVKVSSLRFKTAYEDQGTGENREYLPTADAKQINFVLVDPKAVICEEKYSYMKLFAPGSDSRTADKYLFQMRYYEDLFLIKDKKAGVYINAEA